MEFATRLRAAQFIATFAIGFGILCTQVATFTSVTFYLSAPPFGLSTAALGWLFITYLVGAVLTPIAGRGTVATDDARRFSWRSPWGSAPCC